VENHHSILEWRYTNYKISKINKYNTTILKIPDAEDRNEGDSLAPDFEGLGVQLEHVLVGDEYSPLLCLSLFVQL
jgi:hypothetical protein